MLLAVWYLLHPCSFSLKGNLHFACEAKECWDLGFLKLNSKNEVLGSVLILISKLLFIEEVKTLWKFK